MRKRFDIRPAAESDLPDIARVLVETWQSTFAGKLPADFLEGITVSHQEKRHRRTFVQPDSVYTVAIDRADGCLLGFASGGPTRRPDLPYNNEIYALYVLEAQQGRAIGTGLLRATAGELASSGRTGLIVWVLANNPNRLFYERRGGKAVAVEPIILGSATIDQLAYVWDDIAGIT